MIFIYCVLGVHTRSLCLFYIQKFCPAKVSVCHCTDFFTVSPQFWYFCQEQMVQRTGTVHRTHPPQSIYFYCNGGLGNLCIHPVKVNYFQRATCATKRPWQYSLFKL